MRPERPRPRCGPGKVALTLLSVLPALYTDLVSAQHSESDSWYRVEVLVFRQPGEGGLAAEAWNPTPGLTYPRRVRHLVERELADARLQAFPGSRSRIDAMGRQYLRLPAPRQGDIPPLADPADAVPLGVDIPNPTSTQEVADNASPAASADPSEEQLPLSPEPTRADVLLDVADPETPLPPPALFTVLPDNLRELDGDAARMQSAGYEVMFHQSWVQPVATESDSLGILLDRSGDPDIDEWPRLQGSITLYVSRYLHVSARLWLNTGGDYLHPQWRMPAPPQAPPSLSLALPASDDAVGAATPSPYPYRHALLLDQSRRMRGGELHYLDHPVLGVLIKATRLDRKGWREAYDATQDWAWEDRHNVTLTASDGLTAPRSDRP